MKRGSSLKLTLLIMTGMLLVGVASGIGGYAFGHNALKGITQPPLTPFLGKGKDLAKAPRQGTGFLKERDILAEVESQTQGVAKSAEPKPAKSPKPTAKTSAPKPTASSPKPAAAKDFPIKAEDQGVSLEVRSLNQAEDVVTLEVALKNGSQQEMQFLYSLLDVSDDKGRSLTATTQGLPTTLEPQSETFTGRIEIPTAALATANRLSLRLTNYPEQALNLQVKDVPVAIGDE